MTINKNIKIDRNAPFSVQLDQALAAGYGEPENHDMSLTRAVAILDDIIPSTTKERQLAQGVYDAEHFFLGDPPDIP